MRASYGIFWAAGGYIRANRALYLQGYNAENDLGSNDRGLTPAFAMQDGWPADRFTLPPFLDPSFGFNLGVHILNREDARPPYLQNWTLNIQRQLPGQILAPSQPLHSGTVTNVTGKSHLRVADCTGR